MTETNGDIQSPARRAKLRRMALWALLGAASGAVAWVVVWAAGGGDLAFSFVPGTVFGLVIGVALFVLGYARIWQAALFAALSVAAWYAGYYVGVEYGYDWASGLYSIYLMFFVIGVVGGTAWAIVQTLAVAVLSFARRVRPLATLVAVGAVTGGLLSVHAPLIVETEESLFLILWTGWYAVYAGVLSLFLPQSERREEKKAG